MLIKISDCLYEAQNLWPLRASLWSWCLVVSQACPCSLSRQREHFWCLQKKSEQSHIFAFGSPLLTASQSIWRRTAVFYFCGGLNSCLLSHTHMWHGKRIGKRWLPGAEIKAAQRKIIVMKINIQNEGCAISCSSPADQCAASPELWAATPCQFPDFIYWLWHHMVQDIPFSSWDQLSWLWLCLPQVLVPSSSVPARPEKPLT